MTLSRLVYDLLFIFSFGSSLRISKVITMSTLRETAHVFDNVDNNALEVVTSKLPYHILGMGVAGLDYILSVDKYPKLDDKIRASKCTITGGGNVANTLTAIARLGINSTIYSIVGNDTTADIILGELFKDGVNISNCVHATMSGSAVTHVIVDDETVSRTCIHVPMSTEISLDDVNQLIQSIDTKRVQDIDLIHFDSRQTLAAVTLATYANRVKIPTSIDMEKYRPHVMSLLPICDIVFTNKHFPSVHFQTTSNSGTQQQSVSVSEVPSEEDLLLHVSSMLLQSGWRTRVIVTTLGSSGAILMKRYGDSLEDLRSNKTRPNEQDYTGGSMTVPISLQGCLDSGHPLKVDSFVYSAPNNVPLQVVRCSAWPLAATDIVDSTGAGDAFIGGFLAAFVQGFSEQACLSLASIVAAQKIKGVGSRSKLPYQSDVLAALDTTT